MKWLLSHTLLDVLRLFERLKFVYSLAYVIMLYVNVISKIANFILFLCVFEWLGIVYSILSSCWTHQHQEHPNGVSNESKCFIIDRKCLTRRCSAAHPTHFSKTMSNSIKSTFRLTPFALNAAVDDNALYLPNSSWIWTATTSTNIVSHPPFSFNNESIFSSKIPN